MKSRFSYCEGSEKMTVLFPCWCAEFRDNFFVRRYFLKRGFSVLEYEFFGGVLSVDENLTLKYFDCIKRESVKEIQGLRGEFGFSGVDILGLSIGCVNACMVANEIDVGKLFLILPGSCLVEAVWSGIGTQEIRRSYEERGVGLEDLKKKWKRIAPENNVDKLNCEVFVYRSVRDLVILSEFGERLVRKIGDVECKVDCWKGHYLGVAWFWLFPGMIF